MYIHINYSFFINQLFKGTIRLPRGLTRSMGTRLDAATDEAGAAGKKRFVLKWANNG